MIEAPPTTNRLPVCVIVPAYNRAEMLRRSLHSVLAQRPASPAEVIVVDDGSSDETARVAAEMGATVISHEHNQGLSAARNTGLHATSCPWVAFLDSDDEWLPDHLAHLWELREDHALVAGSALRCGTDHRVDRFHGPVTRDPLVLRSGAQLVFPGNIICVSATMMKRDVALALGGFQARRGVIEDFDLWLRVLEHGHTAVCSPRVSILYYLHNGQMSLQDDRTMQLAHLEAGAAHLRRIGGSEVPLQRWEAVAAWDNLRTALRIGERRRAARWGLYIVARRQRVMGLLGILRLRHKVRRRTAALHAAGVGPPSRARDSDPSG